jgi:hypothetical protein
MVRRSTWILLILFAVLVGFAWLFQRYQTNKAGNAATATPTTSLVKLYDLTNFKVNDINITDNAGTKIDLYQLPGSSNWAITNVPVEKADSTKIGSISAELFSLKTQESLTQSPPLDSIGLATPAFTITMTTTDGAQLITYVGTQTAIGTGYYARVDSGSVVIVDKVAMDDILSLLKNPPMLPTATPVVTPTGTAKPTDLGILGTPTP